MNQSLKEQYMHAVFRFRKNGVILPHRADLNMSELAIMKGIEGNCLALGNHINLSEIQSRLHITKSAVSQMMNSLEKKGYLERRTDTADRRKVIVTLTQTGLDVLEETKETVNQTLEEIISRLGDENTKQLISLLEQVSDISKDVKSKNILLDERGNLRG